MRVARSWQYVLLTCLAIASALAVYIGPPPPVTGGASLAPSWQHPLGTSPYGHDLLRLGLVSTATTGLQACWATLWTGLLGLLVGFTAAARPNGLFDRAQRFIARVFDSLSAFFIAACVLTLAPRLNPWLLGPIAAMLAWPLLANVVRSEAILVLRADYVEAARAIGVSQAGIAIRHVLPAIWERVGPLCLSLVPAFVGLFAALGFIGVGMSSELGIGFLLYDSHAYLRSQPWYLCSMVLGMLALMIATGLLGRRPPWIRSGGM